MAEPIDALFSTPKMSTVFSSEAGLARAEARAGIIPQEAANTLYG